MGELQRGFSSLFRSLSLRFPFLCLRHLSENDLRWPSNLSLSSVKPKLGSKTAPSPQKWGRAPSRCGNTSSASPADSLRSFASRPLLLFHVLSYLLLFSRSTRVFVKLTRCPVGMWICECLTSSHLGPFSKSFFSGNGKYAGCCCVVAVVINIFFFKSSFLYKVQLRRWAWCKMVLMRWEFPLLGWGSAPFIL